MKLRAIVCAATVAGMMHASGFAQNAELNCYTDNDGFIYLNGEQVIMPKKESNPEKDTSAGPITLRQGKNVIGVTVIDRGFQAGLVASIDLSSVGVDDTLRSDGSWSCISGVPDDPAWYTDTAFAEDGWRPAGDYGPLADENGENAKLFFTNSGLEPATLYYHKAHWLWGPKVWYMRRSFEHAGGSGSVMLRGHGFAYKLYLNGELLGEQATKYDRADDLTSWSATLLEGENVIAIEVTCLDSVRFSWAKAGVLLGPRPDSKVLTDSTWKYSWDNPGGWNDVGFDDASWHDVGHMDCYDGKSDALNVPGCNYVAPSVLSFRKVFDVDATITVRPAAQVRAAALRAVPTQWYSLTGRKISKGQVKGAAMGVIVEAAPGRNSAARLNVGQVGRHR
jgi:hypothetical protein